MTVSAAGKPAHGFHVCRRGAARMSLLDATAPRLRPAVRAPSAWPIGRRGGGLSHRLRGSRLNHDEARPEMEATVPVVYLDALCSSNVDGTLDGSHAAPPVDRVTGTDPCRFKQCVPAQTEAFH